MRLIHEHLPRFNRQAKDWARYPYLKLTLNEAFPRLSVVRVAKDDGALYLGPLPSARAAKRVVEAIETAIPLRRCTATPGRAPRRGACAPAQLGVAACPCAGEVSREAYAEVVARAVRGLTHDPSLLLEPLDRRMRALAAEQRFEEAADVRERAAALIQALRRQRRLDGLSHSGRVLVEIRGAGGSSCTTAASVGRGRWSPRRRWAARSAACPPPSRSTRARTRGQGRSPPSARPARAAATCAWWSTTAPTRRSPASWPTSCRAWPPGSNPTPTA